MYICFHHDCNIWKNELIIKNTLKQFEKRRSFNLVHEGSMIQMDGVKVTQKMIE